METISFLDILSRIRSCLLNDDRYIAKEYVELEINNLKGRTEKRCENKQYFGKSYCKYCLNVNCNENKREVLKNGHFVDNLF